MPYPGEKPPSLQNVDQTILVSGINGYIAAVIGLHLLQKGYTVRGTSRSVSAEQKLRREAFKDYSSRYQHYVVPDMTVAGAFDQAAQGVHAIIHTASPLDFRFKTLDEFMVPAIGGILSILNSTKQAGPQLKSFVVTSSTAAIVDRWKHPPTYGYSEADWNENSESVARAQFAAPVAYGASKTAAERALWKWNEDKKPSFSISVVNQAVVTGPPVNWPETPEGLNETLRPIWRLFNGEAREMPAQIGGALYVDVRDVAALPVWCMEHPEESKGQRYMATNGKAPPQAYADILRESYPKRDILVGQPGAGYVQVTYWFHPDNGSAVASKAYKALGVERFIGIQQSILDTIEAMVRRWPAAVATNPM